MWETIKVSLEGTWILFKDGLLLGAGLPIIFALGVRLWAGRENVAADGTVTEHPSNTGTKILAWLCFAVVLLAVIAGIEIIVAAGMGKEVSFEHIFPTIVEKS
ncbi:MAG: hypothetical protein V9G04_03985 [Nocardioides sp.]|jgi:hypothetical protein